MVKRAKRFLGVARTSWVTVVHNGAQRSTMTNCKPICLGAYLARFNNALQHMAKTTNSNIKLTKNAQEHTGSRDLS